MKRKYLVMVLVAWSSLGLQAQKVKKQPWIDFNPAFRFGFQYPQLVGSNFFADDLTESLGFHSSLSLVKIANFRATVGWELQGYRNNNPNRIGNFSHIQSSTALFQVEYEHPLNGRWVLNPTLAYGQSRITYRATRSGTTLARQSWEEIRLGSYANYSFDKTFVGYVGLHYAFLYNSDIKASPADEDYFGRGNKLVLSLGILIH
jgi:hypothetical protein